MSTATEVKTQTTNCTGCGKEFEYEPISFRGHPPLPPPEECGTCGEARREREEEEDRQRQVRDRFERRAKAAQIPRTLRAIEYPDNTHEAVQQWGAGEIQGLCLTGAVGVGKTHLAAAACWHRLQRESIRWVRTAQLLTHLRSGFGEEDSATAKAIIAGVGGVCLDDLDKVNPTEYGREVLFCAIDGRVQEGSPLLVTTNLSLGQISQRLGEAIASRLAGYCRTVSMQGDDRRLA